MAHLLANAVIVMALLAIAAYARTTARIPGVWLIGVLSVVALTGIMLNLSTLDHAWMKGRNVKKILMPVAGGSGREVLADDFRNLLARRDATVEMWNGVLRVEAGKRTIDPARFATLNALASDHRHFCSELARLREKGPEFGTAMDAAVDRCGHQGEWIARTIEILHSAAAASSGFTVGQCADTVSQTYRERLRQSGENEEQALRNLALGTGQKEIRR